MPQKILELLETGSLTEWQIAEKLHISTEEVKAGIDYLLQAGYIRLQIINPTGTGCSGNCGKCNSSCNTQASSGFRAWEIV